MPKKAPSKFCLMIILILLSWTLGKEKRFLFNSNDFLSSEGCLALTESECRHFAFSRDKKSKGQICSIDVFMFSPF